MTHNGHLPAFMLQWRGRFSAPIRQMFEPIGCDLLSLGADMRRHEFIRLVGGAAAAWPLATIFLSCPALSDEQSDQIRAKLLATPIWAYEWFQPPGQADAHGIAGKVNRGKAWFAEKDGKLIGYLDDGWKCDSEVTLRADGFDMETCSAGDKRFVQSGEEFRASWGSYTYAIRPVR